MKEIASIQSNVENIQPSNIEAEQALIGSVLINNDIKIHNKIIAKLPKLTPNTPSLKTLKI